MALQFSVLLRNAALDALETEIGTGAILRFRTGTVPATVATADAGTVLSSLTLPSDWLAAASGGSKAKSGTWAGVGAAAAGAGTNAGHFRIYKSDGTTACIQGTVTVTGGGGDMTLDNISIAENQAISVSSFTLTAGGA